MERSIRTIAPETSASEIAEILDEEGVSGLPVVAGERLVGVVTKTDIARVMAEESENEEEEIVHDESMRGVEEEEVLETRPHLEKRPRIEATARDLMSSNIVTAGEDETAAELASRMLEHHIHRIIVTRRGEVLGVVSSFDLLRAIVEYESHLCENGG